jgi:hypothetical protein
MWPLKYPIFIRILCAIIEIWYQERDLVKPRVGARSSKMALRALNDEQSILNFLRGAILNIMLKAVSAKCEPI